MSSLIKIKNNDKYKLIETKKIKDINSTFNIYQHKITKTKIIFINSKDKEKSFLVSFKTPSHNSKGIQHILEHSILRGSKKYDFGHRESFTEILRNSLLTNINASTHKSYTNYYFSTFVESEFFKVMDIYTDGVFLPKVINNENLFKQEG
ncbi:MAG: insulinase family protein [Candidatus Pacebacteria bacterium]|nr:insulinase family protein [Candidatus Paceibacterota bacterium]